MRNVLSKLLMDQSTPVAEGKAGAAPVAEQSKLSPANMFGVLTCVSALLSAPVCAQRHSHSLTDGMLSAC